MNAAVLRTAPLTILGTSGMPAPEILMDALERVLAYGASGKLRIRNARLLPTLKAPGNEKDAHV
jgi:hypothetical protein